MKRVPQLIFGLFLIALCAFHVEAKPWRGITPGRSTREDVARKLHQTIGDEPRFDYQTASEEIVFIFSPAGYECLRDLPSGTVLEIIAHPKSQLRLEDLSLNKDNLRQLKVPPEYIINGEAYIDEEEGLVIKLLEGKVREIVYTAARSERYLCEAYYNSLGRFGDWTCNFICPTLTVSCPDEAEEGDMVSFSAIIALGVPAIPVTYTWTVTGGEIVEGQRTDRIKVESKGLQGKSITATVEVGGVDASCNRSASCTIAIVRKK